MSLTNDNYKGPKSINSEGFPDNFKLFVDNILPLSLSGKETKARLKRIFPPEKILEIADIMNSFRLGENISKIKNRIKMDINTR